MNLILVIFSFGLLFSFGMFFIYNKFKVVYKELRIGWKILLWEFSVLFTVVISGLIIKGLYIGGWGFKEKIILIYLVFIIWWIIVFSIFWIIYRIKKYMLYRKY